MRIPVALYLLALVARLVVAAGFPDPAYPDSFYYVDVARQLAAGHGFNVDVIWIFAEVGGGSRRTRSSRSRRTPTGCRWRRSSRCRSSGCWGRPRMASAIPFALIGAVAAPLAWAIGRDAGAPSFVGIGAAS